MSKRNRGNKRNLTPPINSNNDQIVRKTFKLTKWQFYGMIIGLFFGVASWLYTAISFHSASAAGQYATSKIVTKIGKVPLRTNRPNIIIFGKNYSDTTNIYEGNRIEVDIFNEGEKTVEKIEVDFVYPNLLVSDLKTSEFNPLDFPEKVNTNKTSKGEFTHDRISIPYLNPGKKYELLQPIMIGHLNTFDINREIRKTGDNKNFAGTLYMGQINIMSKDTGSISYPLKIYIVEANSTDELKEKVNGIIDSETAELPFSTRVKQFLSTDITEGAFITHYPVSKELVKKVDNKELYFIRQNFINVVKQWRSKTLFPSSTTDPNLENLKDKYKLQ